MIYIVRGQKVMLDSDLAELYGVLTKNLNKAVKRNEVPNWNLKKAGHSDFIFQLSKQELTNLRSQFVTSSEGYSGRLK